jgi:hypothetical protein
MKACRECGKQASVLHGLCWECRERAGGPKAVERARSKARHPSVVPARHQPWVPTNQLADRLRRSPRQ